MATTIRVPGTPESRVRGGPPDARGVSAQIDAVRAADPEAFALLKQLAARWSVLPPTPEQKAAVLGVADPDAPPPSQAEGADAG